MHRANLHLSVKKAFRTRFATLPLAIAALLFAAVTVQAASGQTAPPAPASGEKVASVHGTATDPAGGLVANGIVKLAHTLGSSLTETKFVYSFPTDASGTFKGTDIAPGTYSLVLFQADKSVDFMRDIKLPSGVDTVVNFDMTREEYLKTLKPEERKAIEEFKKKNAEATAANGQIKNLNTLLANARADMKAGNYDTAVASMQQATTAKPDEALLWYTLGDAQLGAKKFDDAVVSYKKSLELDATAKKPNPEVAASADNNLAQAYAKAGKTTEAVAAYEAAAKALPAKAGTYYLNEAIVLYTLQKSDESAVAADKAIAADPTKVDAYFVKGQDLITKATVDPKTSKITVPEECIEAYQKYLALAPTGPHAEEIKQILAGIGEKINSNYKATRKK